MASLKYLTVPALCLLAFCYFFLCSCGSRHHGEKKPTLLSNMLNITDNEDKGVKTILGYYGGYCEYAVGRSASSDKGGIKYFKLELSNSVVIESNAGVAEMPASNIAYLFYHNLKEEKNNYDEIHTVLVFKDGSKREFAYPKDKLEMVDIKMSVVEKVVALLRDKNFNAIEQMIIADSSLIQYNDRKKLVTRVAEFESQFGRAKEFSPRGFRLFKIKDGRDILHISGIILRDKKNTEFSVDFDLMATGDTIIQFNYIR
jgi:hypothetical protein